MYDSSDLRKGLKIEIDGDPYVIVQFEFVKPGKGPGALQMSAQEHDQRFAVR